ncbi:MAG: EcsC family protein [Candidatus Coatesbacteria bacterium]|nr:EcsC family protein [Candidatus Coatesbacteria bacterium]
MQNQQEQPVEEVEVIEIRPGEKSLTPYETLQISEINNWMKEEPGVISKALGEIIAPFTKIVQSIIPQSAIKGILDFGYASSKWLARSKVIKRKAGVKNIEELQHMNLETCDKLADDVHKWAIGIATLEGASTGATGFVGIGIDVPSILILALRTIHRIGLCYGFEAKTEQDKQFVFSILSAAGANTVEEKTAALITLKTLSKETAYITIRKLAQQIGLNLTKRKLLAAIPAIGAVVGGSSNYWFIKEISNAARRSFQEKWLQENRKIDIKKISTDDAQEKA